MEIENASLIDKKHFENVENFKQTVNHFYGELRLFSNALNANGL